MHILIAMFVFLSVMSCVQMKKDPEMNPGGSFPPPPIFKIQPSYDEITHEYEKNDPQQLTDQVKQEIETMLKGAETDLLAAYERLKLNIEDKQEQRSFTNTIEVLDDFYNVFNSKVSWFYLLMNVHPSNHLREAMRLYVQEAEKYDIELSMNEVIYAAVNEVARTAQGLTGEQRMIIDDMVIQYRLVGMDKDRETRAAIKQLKQELSDLDTEFSQNIAKHNDPTLVDRADLTGLDEKYISRLSRDGEKYLLDLSGPVVFPLLKQCTNEELRKTILFKYQNRAAIKNKPLLKTVQQKRYELAGLLGFPTHAHARLVDRMTGNPDVVLHFLDELRDAFREKGEEEVKVLTGLKRELTGDENALLQPWDIGFYADIYRGKTFKLDPKKFPEYFPLQKVILEGLFDVYQTVFSVRFKQSEKKFYHPDVLHYEVYDKDRQIGAFLMDLFPRPNKYSHAAQFGLVKHKIFAGGKEQLPLAAIVCNFTKPTESEPSLLEPSEVVTLFHEFGHLMHTMLSETKYMMLSGTSVKRDFVEVPSQLLERWPMNRSVISKFAQHYKTDEPIPEEYIDYMEEQQKFLSGINTSTQIFFATYDMTIHGVPPFEDSTELWKKLSENVPGRKYFSGTVPEASFGHLMGYDAGYYGYLWANMISSDMFATFKEKGLFDGNLGMSLRKNVLAKGGTIDPNELIKAFLGRAVQPKAFFEEMGVAPAMEKLDGQRGKSSAR